MKKTLTIIALILAITVSLIAGTMSYYYTDLGIVAEGSVVAKEFILLENGTDTFKTDLKIAPGEKAEWVFAVKNHDGALISETAMDLDFKVELKATDGKTAILPLQVMVADESATTRTITGEDTLEFNDQFGISQQGQTRSFKVVVSWPWETEDSDGNTINDVAYAGAGHGSTITVSVTGTQVDPKTGD